MSFGLGGNRHRVSEANRRGPVLNETVRQDNEFRFTCSFDSNVQPHSSGYSVSLNIPGRQVGERFRSGEQLNGFVEIKELDALQGGPRKSIRSCLLRCWYQSTTLYTLKTIAPAAATPLHKFQGYHQNAAPRIMTRLKSDSYRRNIINDEGLELWESREEALMTGISDDFPLLDADRTSEAANLDSEAITAGSLTEASNRSLPFSFILPTAGRMDTSDSTVGIPRRPLDRDSLMRLDRPPPPSLAFRGGCVEYCVEVLLRFDENDPHSEDLPPSILGLNPLGEGGLHFPNPSLLVHRILFPFEPMDRDIPDLYSSWGPAIERLPDGSNMSRRFGRHASSATDLAVERGIVGERIVEFGGVPPSFARDVRDESLGGTVIFGNARVQSQLVKAQGGNSKWMSIEKVISRKNLLGALTSTIRTEVAVPFPTTTSRHNPSLPIIFRISHRVAESSTLKKLKPILIDKVVLVLIQRTATRSGAELRPSFLFEELRRQEIKVWSTMASDHEGGQLTQTYSKRDGEIEDGRRHLILALDGDVEFELSFDLQNQTSSTFKSIPLREACTSFRTPNLEREYIISITIHFIGAESLIAARVPIQVLAGDHDPLPSFDFDASFEDRINISSRADASSIRIESMVEQLPQY